MAHLELQRHNYRAVPAARRRVLLHVPTTAVYELDGVASDVLDFAESRDRLDAECVQAYFDGRHVPGDVCDTLRDFIDLGILAPQRAPRGQDVPQPRPVKRTPINTLALILTTGCNLGCSYCYRDNLADPRHAQVMDEDTGRQAIDLLFSQAEGPRVNIVFFGGEPLTRFATLRALTAHAREKAEAAGWQVDFSLTTNATLIDDAMIGFFVEHDFGIAVSIDGEAADHDRHRLSLGGQGTYARVAANVARLLAAPLRKPVGARVTVSAGNTDLARIYRHLHDEMGFSEVGFAPVTAAPGSPQALSDAELQKILAAMMSLGRDYVAATKRGQAHGFANMKHLMRDLAQGTRKLLPCGAGIGMLAATTEGELALCHRFAGSGTGTFGDVRTGVDLAGMGAFLESAQSLPAACRDCMARRLCAGGCYHEAFVQSGDPLAPTRSYCDFVRAWIEFGLQSYGEIVMANPAALAEENPESRTLA